MAGVRLPGGWEMRRVLASVGTALCVGGCVGSCSSTATPAQAPSSGAQASPTAAAPDGGARFADVALDASDVPASFTGNPPRSAVEGYAETQQVLQRRQFSPPQCGTLSAVTAASAPVGLSVSFSDDAAEQGLSEFLAPAGDPTLANLQADVESCGTVTAFDPTQNLQLGGGVVVVGTPQVPAERTLGMQSTTISTVAGKPSTTSMSTTYLAETDGVLVSVSAKGARGGPPVDPAVVAAVFTRAVAKVNGAR